MGESLINKPMMRNSLICKLINVQASMKENNENKIKKEDEISKLIKAFPKDIAALDKRSVLAKVNSQGSGIRLPFSLELYFVLLMKSHLQSYPCPLQINSFWNLGFLLAVAIILQIITGIFLALHYTSDLNSAYSSVFFLIREVYY